VRIAIDARELHGHATGVGTYLSTILNEWDTLPAAAAHDVILCAPDAGGGTWWEQRVLPGLVRDAKADVLFSPGYTTPLFPGVPAVVAIHDVSFAAHPEWFGRREGLRRRTLTRLSARRAARVLTISEFSKREIVAHLGITPDKIEVVYPAVFPSDVGRTGQGSRHTILFTGSLFNRRHIPELVDGFARLARTIPDARLDIVGENRTIPRIDLAALVAASGAGDRIALRSYVPASELPALYARARAFVFLSEYEGFGLTPLEALTAGVPIVVLDTPVAREVYGAAALYVQRPDPALIEAALRRVLTDDAERTRILNAGRDTVARYPARRCAERVLDTLVSCSRCRGSR
jgi:glycosyltransferase involved in cell wall biosynthesis